MSFSIEKINKAAFGLGDDERTGRQLAFARVLSYVVEDFCKDIDDGITLVACEAQKNKAFPNLLKLEIVLDFDKQ